MTRDNNSDRSRKIHLRCGAADCGPPKKIWTATGAADTNGHIPAPGAVTATAPKQPAKKRRRSGPGFTLPGFSEKFNIPIGTVRRAVRDGQIATIAFGGRNLITPSEAERIAALFDLKPRDGPNAD
jgi:hypothetical protein